MGRAPCCAKEGVNRGAWTAVEDKLLVEYINQHGEGKWRSIPKLAGLKRCGKSCRLRWLNYLRPDIKRGNIEPEEEDLIIRLHRLLGNRWSLIAGRLPGRTDNEIKNYWNTTLSKKRQQSGVSSTSAGNIQTSNPDHQEENKEKKIKKKKMKTTKPPAIPLPVNSLTRSKAVRTKAMRCTKVIIPINDNNPVSDDVDNKWMIGADPRQDDSSHNKYWNSINEGGDNQFHHEYYGSLSGATTSGSGELDGRTNSGGEEYEEDQLLDELLDFENFPSDFHKVVVGDQIGIASGSTTTAADTDFWSMLNDWVDMEDDDDDDNIIINNKKQGEGYQLLQ